MQGISIILESVDDVVPFSKHTVSLTYTLGASTLYSGGSRTDSYMYTHGLSIVHDIPLRRACMSAEDQYNLRPRIIYFSVDELFSQVHSAYSETLHVYSIIYGETLA